MQKEEASDGARRDGIEETLARIFRQVSEIAIPTSDGLVSWNAPGWFRRAKKSESHLMGPQLYDGTSGITLFLAAYYWATKSADARDLALRSAARLRCDVTEIGAGTSPRSHRFAGTRGLSGVASVSYPLAKLAEWLKMPELLESAHEAATALTPQQILAEKRFDVTGGCAGTLLALLSFIEELSAREADVGMAMELALLCGRRLLETRIRLASGLRAWPAADSTASAGFGYGASGIGYALIRLFQHTGREEFRDAAIEAFAFERGLFSYDPQSWIQPNPKSPIGCASWNQGAPGIALGRLISTLMVDSNALRHDLQEALSITRALPVSPTDDLCYGNCGRADIMYSAGSILGRLDLTEHARDLAKQVVSRAAVSGFRFQAYSYDSDLLPYFDLNPSLFFGLSGVGYTLLRLSYPDLFPSALFLETLG